jgi:hypothetical protein
MIFSCVVSFKRKKKKIPDLSLPPCTVTSHLDYDNVHTVPVCRIRFRIHQFLGLLDPDPLVRCMDPDLDPSIIEQK